MDGISRKLYHLLVVYSTRKQVFWYLIAWLHHDVPVPETDVFGTVTEIGAQHSRRGGVFVSKPSTEINVSHLE